MEGKDCWLVAGGLNLDSLAKPSGDFRLHDSNPGFIQEGPGGVGFNLARNLARLDQRVYLLSARGEDRAGQALLELAGQAGVDLTHLLVRSGCSTSRYQAMHDETGEMVAAINDMSIFDEMTEDDIDSWLPLGADGCKGAFVEANLPQRVLRRLAEGWQVPLFADAVSVAKIDRLTDLLPLLEGLKVNRIEAAHLTGRPVGKIEEALAAARCVRDRGVRRLCLSLDVDGAVFADQRRAIRVRSRPPAITGNATGAGDAMAAAFAWAVVEGYGLEEVARLGSAAAALAMEVKEAFNPALTAGLLLERAADIETEVIYE